MDHDASQNEGYLDEVMRTFCMGIGSLSERTGPYGEAKGGNPTRRPVQGYDLLSSVGRLKPLTSRERHAIRKMALDTLAAARTSPDACSKPPFAIGPPSAGSVPTVKCTMALTAIEHDDWMPQDVVVNCVGVWRTGAEITYITEDVLAPKFRRFINEDFIHQQYRLPGQAGTVVRISCLLKLSNGDSVQVDTVAVVVPMDVAPMRRSGVTFGQKGLIDSVTCTFHPASVTAAGGLGARQDGWGRIDIESYVGLDGTLYGCEE